MWNRKRFATETAARQWMADNKHRYQCVFIFGNNCCYVEWRKLRRVY